MDFCSVGFWRGGFFPLGFLGREDDDDDGLEGLVERLLVLLDDPVFGLIAMLSVAEVEVIEVFRCSSQFKKSRLRRRKVSPMPWTEDIESKSTARGTLFSTQMLTVYLL